MFLRNSLQLLSQLGFGVWPDRIIFQAHERAATDGRSQVGTKEEEENEQTMRHNYALKTACRMGFHQFVV